MKREIQREVRLPAFSLLIGELELLWQRMTDLFQTDEGVRASINLSFPTEKLQFDSIAELQEFGKLRGRVTNFSLKVAHGSRSVVVQTGGLFNNTPTLRVEAESDVWCAGAIEAVFSVIRPNRVWYSWFVRAPLTLLFLVLALAPTVVSKFFPKMPAMPIGLVVTWLSVVVVLGYVSYSKDKLLPEASLVFTQELGFIRRYGSELGLLLGLVSLILAIYTWLYPYAA